MRSIYKREYRGGDFSFLFNKKAFILYVALIPLLFQAACSEQPAAKAPEEIIARVDGRPITRALLDRALRVLLHQGDEETKESEKLDDEEMRELKRSVLNELIEEEIVIEEARKQKILITPEELNDTISVMMGNTDRDTFNKAIVPLYGSFENWSREIERKLLVARVIDGVKGSVEEISDWEVSKYFIRNEEEYRVPEQVKAAMIMVATEEEAAKVKARLAAGEDFSELAKELSISPEAASGGELGVFSLGEMPQEFEEIVFKIPPRVPSKVVKTGYGYHIFLVHERKKGRKLRFENVKEDIKAKLMAEKADQKLMEWILSLKKEASIEILEEI